MGKKSITFAMISDTQGWYDETEEVVNAINKRKDIDFVIHGGDQSDYGVTKEFIWMRDVLQKLKVPYVCVIGNHDCLGNGEEIYKKIYGNDNFAFTAGNVRFICLNTNALEYDYSHPVPDFVFLDSLKANFPETANKTVFAMHVKPTDFIFNNNVATIFEKYVTSFPQTQFCLYGHNHSVSVDDVFGDGTIYYECACIKKRSYLVFTIKEEGGYDYEVVSF
jgi:predicted phosphodiesterase